MNFGVYLQVRRRDVRIAVLSRRAACGREEKREGSAAIDVLIPGVLLLLPRSRCHSFSMTLSGGLIRTRYFIN